MVRRSNHFGPIGCQGRGTVVAVCAGSDLMHRLDALKAMVGIRLYAEDEFNGTDLTIKKSLRSRSGRRFGNSLFGQLRQTTAVLTHALDIYRQERMIRFVAPI
jgi:hypothetical protein